MLKLILFKMYLIYQNILEKIFFSAKNKDVVTLSVNFTSATHFFHLIVSNLQKGNTLLAAAYHKLFSVSGQALKAYNNSKP